MPLLSTRSADDIQGRFALAVAVKAANTQSVQWALQREQQQMLRIAAGRAWALT